jgi:hypothetical protein
MTRSATLRTVEGTDVAGSVNTTLDVDGTTASYAIVGGADADCFTIEPDGTLRFISAPDHESPADADGDNAYDVRVMITAGDRSETVEVTVQVRDVPEDTSYDTATALGDGTDGGWDVPIIGTDGNDDIAAGDFHEGVHAGKGDDRITVGTSDYSNWSRIDTSSGNDEVRAGDGWEMIETGDGADVIATGDGDAGSYNAIYSGKDDDSIVAGDDWNKIDTGAGDDLLNIGNDGSRIETGDGADTIHAGDGWSEVYTGKDDDSLSIGNANAGESAKIDTSTGADTVTAGDGWSHVTTGDGNDHVEIGNADTAQYGEIHTGDDNDTLTAGDGWDRIDSGSGNDVVSTGDADANGASVIVTGDGSDTLTAGDNWSEVYTGKDDDTVSLGDADPSGYGKIDTGSGNDTLSAGHGWSFAGTGDDNDKVTIGDADADDYAELYTGKGDDTLTAGDGWDKIVAGAGHDTVTAGDGTTFVDGGDDNDTVSVGDAGDGYAGAYGGKGDDSLTVGDGWNKIDAGAGDDSIYSGTGTGALFGGDGNDTISVDLSDPSGGGTILDGGAGQDTMILRGLDADDITYTGSEPGEVSGYATLSDGSTFTFSHIENVVICFTVGTRILTPRGQRPIEDLRPGDEVVTLDHGVQVLRWTGRHRVPGRGNLAPVRIAAGALENARALLVSPQHRMLHRSAAANLYFGSPQVLIPARHLVNGTTIVQRAQPQVEYVHLMFDNHEIVWAEGCPSESFHPGTVGLSALAAPAREELFTLFPELRSDPGCNRRTARRCLRAHESHILSAI